MKDIFYILACLGSFLLGTWVERAFSFFGGLFG